MTDSWKLLRRLRGAGPDHPQWQILLERCDLLVRAALRSGFSGGRSFNPELVDDLAQDVMERLLADERRILSRFSGTSRKSFDGYIRRIAENILLDELRRESVRREFEESFAPEDVWKVEAALAEGAMENVHDDPEAALLMREINEDVERTLCRISLDDRQRALNRLVFRLYFRDGYSIAQIARLRTVPLSISSVGRKIEMLRRALRKSLAARRRLASVRPSRRRRRIKHSPI